VQAKEEFRRLPVAERRQMIEVLQSGILPMPRDLSAIMLAELNTVSSPTDQRPLNSTGEVVVRQMRTKII
jgi:hypothetical protein